MTYSNLNDLGAALRIAIYERYGNKRGAIKKAAEDLDMSDATLSNVLSGRDAGRLVLGLIKRDYGLSLGPDLKPFFETTNGNLAVLMDRNENGSYGKRVSVEALQKAVDFVGADELYIVFSNGKLFINPANTISE